MIHGTCSICGGPVETPDYWLGINPPIPTCSRCGATMAEPFGEKIDMVPPKRKSDKEFIDDFWEKVGIKWTQKDGVVTHIEELQRKVTE